MYKQPKVISIHSVLKVKPKIYINRLGKTGKTKLFKSFITKQKVVNKGTKRLYLNLIFI